MMKNTDNQFKNTDNDDREMADYFNNVLMKAV